MSYKDYIKAILQSLYLFIPFVGMRVLGLFVGIYAINSVKYSTNIYGEREQEHRQKYKDLGSSGKWEYVKPASKFLYWWGNEEDGYLGEGSGKWSASVDGNERSKWNMYRWSAIRNPANNFSRYHPWYGCPVNDCDVKYVGAYHLDDNDTEATGTQLVVATHRYTGREYYGFRHVWKWPFLKRVFHIRIGFKLRPSHAAEIQDADDRLKGWSLRFALAPRLN